jgi:hypothetical protein
LMFICIKASIRLVIRMTLVFSEVLSSFTPDPATYFQPYEHVFHTNHPCHTLFHF